MNCKQTRKVLSRYLDHELLGAEASSVEEHMADCPECRTELETQRRLWTVLGRLEPVRSPDMVAAVESRLSERRRWRGQLDRLRPRSFGHAMAAAGVVGLAVWTGLWAAWARQGVTDPHDRPFAELLNDSPPGMEIAAVLDQIGERR